MIETCGETMSIEVGGLRLFSRCQRQPHGPEENHGGTVILQWPDGAEVPGKMALLFGGGRRG